MTSGQGIWGAYIPTLLATNGRLLSRGLFELQAYGVDSKVGS